MEMPDLNSLPPALQKQLRGQLLEFLAEIGVQPLIDQRTGGLVVKTEDPARALGMSLEEAREAFRDSDGLQLAHPEDLGLLQ